MHSRLESSMARSAARTNDQAFFVFMALAIAVTVIGGFGSWALRGNVDVATVPYWVHVHGAVFVAWTLLFVAQALLAHRGTIALHRRLGWTATGLAAAMVPLGVVTAVMAVRLGRVPSFFTPEIFLSLSALELIAFLALLVPALRLRRITDWHKRLMLCAMIALIGPAFGRVLPMDLLGQMAGPAVMGSQLVYVAIGMAHDLITRRRVHPAYAIGAAVIVVEGVGVPLLAGTPPLMALAAALAP
ncbi:putative membrane protein [Sphingobium sp. OAS761]|uniref:hypothetical protein n=1 Tax=Sphingobium sp. OAS761 TaxID=2817901 RepID=UPI00209D07CC|nr:hypothetical protein [Sphingobium sp. OAS761]MCP1468528.1 putative membrane protein [Sphingobium sp. OAS761]